MINNILVGVFVFLFLTSGNSQTCPTNEVKQWQWKSHSNWFFGDGLFLNFSEGTGLPKASYKDVLGNNHYQGYEATTIISDINGHIQAYSNGRYLWDSAGVTLSDEMLAGNESGAVGMRGSSAQGVLSVRHPTNPHKVYLFTTDDALTSTGNGVNYSVFNVKTNKVTKPVRLKNDAGIDYRPTEQLDATFHSNGIDIWVIVRQSGRNSFENFRNFYSYLITCEGLNLIPVKSDHVVPETGKVFNTGALSEQSGSWRADMERGALKASWDGTKIATVNDVSGAESDEATMIFDFDNTTGVLSNCKPVARLTGDWSWVGFDYSGNYDCEWSPDSKGLFISSRNNILWLDASLSSVEEIHQSTKIVSTHSGNMGDIKLGGDGLLYQSTAGDYLNTWSFMSVNDLNSGTNAEFNVFPLPRSSSRGFSNMFLPYSEELKIEEPYSVCDTVGYFDFGASWECLGIDGEYFPHQWNSSKGAFTNSQTGEYDPSIAGDGNDTIIFTATSNCTFSDTLILHINKCGSNVTSVLDELLGELFIFPNPTENEVTVSVDNYTNLSSVTIKVLDALGTLVHQQLITWSTQSIDVSSWTAGVYFLHVMNGSKTVDIRKIVVNN